MTLNMRGLARTGAVDVEMAVRNTANALFMQRISELPESFDPFVAPMVVKERPTLKYHPSLSSRDLNRLKETYPWISFVADESAGVKNDHECAALARRAATLMTYEKMKA